MADALAESAMRAPGDDTAPLLSVRGLCTSFTSAGRLLPVLSGVSFDLWRGETLGIVGESGSGKSVTSLSIMRLIPEPPGRIVAGEVMFDGCDLLKLPASEMRAIRGNEISMIFQEPMTSLNPVFKIGDQIGEAVRRHRRIGREEVHSRTIELLKLVGIPSPESRAEAFPHELSGGMRQRVVIAMALACDPKVLIADEPTTALDVTIQAQILDLLRDLKDRLGMSVILITHDIGVIAEMADRVLVMYAGRIVEEAPVRALFRSPRHPYTQGLLSSVPDLDAERDILSTIEGVVPNPAALPPGCRFEPRCSFARPACRTCDPAMVAFSIGHHAACIRHTDYMQPDGYKG